MSILKFTAQNFRNFTELTVEPSPTINLFYGENAAGKTSLLEAIYYLSLGRSFRTRILPRVIQHEQTAFTLFALIEYHDDTLTIGMERTQTGNRQLHIGGKTEPRQSVAIKHLPILFISTNSYRYFYDGPKARRSFLDWGVFHVKHRFHMVWQSLQKVLKQRNESLRQGLIRSQVQIWDIELASLGEQIDQWRQEYVSQLSEILDFLLLDLNSELKQPLALRYERGWPKGKSLLETLSANWLNDLRLGYTQSGPQRADLNIYAGSIPADDVLSQGQQKQVAYSLYLAQGILFKQINQHSPIYLIDDLPAELDHRKCLAVARTLNELQAQVFITGITQASLMNLFFDKFKMFHVKHGTILQE